MGWGALVRRKLILKSTTTTTTACFNLCLGKYTTPLSKNFLNTTPLHSAVRSYASSAATSQQQQQQQASSSSTSNVVRSICNPFIALPRTFNSVIHMTRFVSFLLIVFICFILILYVAFLTMLNFRQLITSHKSYKVFVPLNVR